MKRITTKLYPRQSLGMLTLSSALQRPPPHHASSPPSTPVARHAFFVALYLMALAQGFHRPCTEAFGADQFAASDGGDSGAHAARSSYFNWYHFSISWGYALSSTVLSYLEDNVGWTVGFGTCWAAMVLGFAIFLLGTRTYHAEQPVGGSQFVEAVRALTAKVFRGKDTTAITEP